MSFNKYPSARTGTGDVNGPASSTDNAVVRWDGTSGQNVKDSGVTVSDIGDIQTPSGLQVLSDDLIHYAELLGATGMSVNVTLRLPVTTGSIGQALQLGGDGQTFTWFTPFVASSFTQYKTNLPMKMSAQAASTATIDMGAGNPGTIDGVDFTFGGTVLLKNQTDPMENGLWVVDGVGVWSRESTMPDNTGSAYSAIVAVNSGGVINGNTIWYSTSIGDGNVPFVQIPNAANPTRLVSYTTMARDALTGVVKGMLIYNSSTDKFQGYNGAWVDLN